jgi:hypothetical protein
MISRFEDVFEPTASCSSLGHSSLVQPLGSFRRACCRLSVPIRSSSATALREWPPGLYGLRPADESGDDPPFGIH